MWICTDHHFSPVNGRIATKLAHDGLQVSLCPRCAQGQGQRSRDTGTFVLARKSLLEDYWDMLKYSLFASTLQSTISCILIQFARWQHDIGRSLLSMIALYWKCLQSVHILYQSVFCKCCLILCIMGKNYWLSPSTFKYTLGLRNIYWWVYCVIFSASSVGFAIVLKLHFVDFLEFLLWVVFVDCIGVGVVIATALWWVLSDSSKEVETWYCCVQLTPNFCSYLCKYQLIFKTFQH